MKKKLFVVAAVMLSLGGVVAGHWHGVPRSAHAQEPCPDDLSACTYGNGGENSQPGTDTQTGDNSQSQGR